MKIVEPGLGQETIKPMMKAIVHTSTSANWYHRVPYPFRIDETLHEARQIFS